MHKDTLPGATDNRSATLRRAERFIGSRGIKPAEKQQPRGRNVTPKSEKYAVAGLEDIARLALDIQGITPLSMMFRGFGVASQGFAINSAVAQHLQDAAMSQAQSMLRFGHEIAGIWIEAEPIGPIGVASKLNRTQDALLHHIKTTADDGLDRFQILNEVVRGQ